VPLGRQGERQEEGKKKDEGGEKRGGDRGRWGAMSVMIGHLESLGNRSLQKGGGRREGGEEKTPENKGKSKGEEGGEETGYHRTPCRSTTFFAVSPAHRRCIGD